MLTNQVLEYKCPCCDAGLPFSETAQRMKCQYCDNEFDLETVIAYNEDRNQPESSEFHWDASDSKQWSPAEAESLRSFTCPACGGILITDDHTAATFCPYCENPAILPGRLSGGLRPDAVLPFKNSKEDAQKAFSQLCKGKPLLPKFFTQEQRLEKITGIYVPFWLYDCDSTFSGSFKATRMHTWSDSRFHYTRTDHYHLTRGAQASFAAIPMDASTKMDDAIMESIEPFDYSQLMDFETAYLSGFLADKYDVESAAGQARIEERVGSSMNSMIQDSIMGYSTVVPSSRRLNVTQGKAKYVLLPVWMLYTKYRDKTYVFAMNGQTGKMTGSFPICPKRTAAWFSGICAAVTALAAAVQMLIL